MSETSNIYTRPVDATDFTPSTEVDFHIGNPNLASLDAARQAQKLAEEALTASSPEEIANEQRLAYIAQASINLSAARNAA